MIVFNAEEKRLLQKCSSLSKKEALRALTKKLRRLDHYDYDRRDLIETVMDKLDLMTEMEYDNMDFDPDFYDPDYDPSVSAGRGEDDDFTYSMFHDDEYDEGAFDPEFSDYI